jgi:hypothetical protein
VRAPQVPAVTERDDSSGAGVVTEVHEPLPDTRSAALTEADP